MIGVIVYYIRVVDEDIAIIITIIVIVVVIAMLHFPETHHCRRRGRFVGWVLTVAAFIAVVPISLDIARHGIALAMYGFILVALCAHAIISRRRPPSTDGIAMTGRISLPADIEDLVRFIEQQTTRQLPPYYENLFRFMEEQISSLGMTIARTTGSLLPPSTSALETLDDNGSTIDDSKIEVSDVLAASSKVCPFYVDKAYFVVLVHFDHLQKFDYFRDFMHAHCTVFVMDCAQARSGTETPHPKGKSITVAGNGTHPSNNATPLVEKYRPQSLDVTSLIPVDEREETAASIAVWTSWYGSDYCKMILELNALDDRGIDVLWQQIQDFASMIEKYMKNTRFALICNHVNKIIPALQFQCLRFRFAPLDPVHVIGRLRLNSDIMSAMVVGGMNAPISTHDQIIASICLGVFVLLVGASICIWNCYRSRKATAVAAGGGEGAGAAAARGG
ncbi:Replication factor C subunit 5 [Linum perenne]